MDAWSRRTVLSGVASVLAGSPTNATAGQPLPLAADSLDTLARAKGLRFGSEAGVEELTDARYRAIVLAECGVIVPGNELKWEATQPREHQFAFFQGDWIAAFAHRHALLLRGHNLLSLRSMTVPYWVTRYHFGADGRKNAERILTKHFTVECKRYPQIRSWDVINEAIDRETGLVREGVLTAAMGPEVIDYAFHLAHEAAPQAQLVYNDYMSWNRSFAAHRQGVLRLLADLRKRQVPVDALGIQSHLGPRPNDTYPASAKQQETDWRKFLDEVAAMGYVMLITELDINDNELGDARTRDAAAADYMRAYLDLTLSYRQVQHVLTWGLVDKYSWQSHVHPRTDGLPNHPLPYGSNYRPKPLRQAIAAALRAAPSRA